jgi:hypothetical protein
LEAQLQKDAGLRVALDGLRQTRGLLRSAPQMKAPRNYTLTPEMAGARARSARMYAPVRLVSVLATILFVVVVMGDVLTGGGTDLAFLPFESADSVESSGADTAEMAAEAPAEGAAPEAMEPALAEEEADLADADVGDVTRDDGVMKETASEPVEEVEGTTAPEVMGTPTAVGTGIVEEPAAQDAGADAEDTGDGAATGEPDVAFFVPTGTTEVEAALVDEPLDEEQARAMTPPEIAEGDGDEFGEVGGGAVEEEPRQLDLLLIIVRAVEVGLALVAVGAGVTALAMRRKSRAK